MKWKLSPVTDAKGVRAAGLWIDTNGVYWVQFREPGKRSATKTKLSAGLSLAQAKMAQRKLAVQKQENTLPVLRKTPTLGAAIDEYFAWHEGAGKKKRSTLLVEERLLKFWRERIGALRVSQIPWWMIQDGVRELQKRGLCGSTCDSFVFALNSVLRRELPKGTRLPTAEYERLREKPAERPLWTLNDIERLCRAAEEKEARNAADFRAYIYLLAYSGLRRNEALALKWEDIDFGKGLIYLRRQYAIRKVSNDRESTLKSGKSRQIPFNSTLKRHLVKMQAGRAPDSAFLFPSPHRHSQDRCRTRFQDTLELAKEGAGMGNFHLHDLRHFFISLCVMNGIDALTISKWVGHHDKGFLISNTYSHVYEEHERRQADKLVFEPTVIHREPEGKAGKSLL